MKKVKINNNFYNFKETLQDISVKDYIILSKKIKELTETQSNSTLKADFKNEDALNQVDTDLKIFGLVKEIVMLITSIPSNIIDGINYKDLVNLINLVKYDIGTPLEQKTLIFNALPLNEINQKQKEFEQIKKINFIIKNKKAKELERSRNCEYEVITDPTDKPFGVIVATQEIKKEVIKMGGEISEGYYEKLPLLLAYICYPKGTKNTLEGVERRAKIFEDVPMQDALNITGFFLLTLKSLLANL